MHKHIYIYFYLFIYNMYQRVIISHGYYPTLGAARSQEDVFLPHAIAWLDTRIVNNDQRSLTRPNLSISVGNFTSGHWNFPGSQCFDEPTGIRYFSNVQQRMKAL
jgi:hypothetical protein